MKGDGGNARGFSIIEVVIASAILGIVLFSLASVFLLASRLSREASNKIRANFLAEEGLEVMRFLRDQSWDQNIAPLLVGTSYYLTFATTTSAWDVLTTNPGLADGLFTRAIKVEEVRRDSNDDIVSSGGTVDPDSLKIISSISWGPEPVNTITVETYLSDIFNN